MTPSAAAETTPDRPTWNEPASPHKSTSRNEPTIESLREGSFSGFGSFAEAEQPNTAGRRVALLVVLLVALGGAGWWTYTNYVGVGQDRHSEERPAQGKPAAGSSITAQAPVATVPNANSQTAPSSPNASSPSPAPSANVAPSASETAGRSRSEEASKAAEPAAPDASNSNTEKNSAAEERAAIPPPVTPAPAKRIPTKTTPVFGRTPKPKVEAAIRPANLPAPAASDTGDADFRKGEAYLYGRGASQNCDQAIRSLKAASAKSSAKARSTFGTMYATGHCVPRDLPTSYLWFALALRIDPNNQILEQDLNAIWNQMTPPERQMATRMKQ